MTRKEKIISDAVNELGSRVRAAQTAYREKELSKAKAAPELAEAKARLGYIDTCIDHKALGIRVSSGIKEIAGEKNAYIFNLSYKELESERAAEEALVKTLSEGAKAQAENDKDRYYCPVCKDKGYVKDSEGIDRRCSCFKEIFARKIREASGLPEGNFELTAPPEGLYPDKADKNKYGIPSSPADNAAKTYALARKFADDLGPGSKKILFITGAVGVGKTYLACCVGQYSSAQCRFVCYSGIASVLDSLQNRFFNSDEERESYEERREFIEKADMLIIDDLGVESVTDKRYENLITLIDKRSAEGRKTVITSNYDLADIKNVYGERLASRFADFTNSTCLRLVGDDIRLIKNRVK